MSDKDKKTEGQGRKALKSGVWYTAANFLTKGIAFITTPIFTRLLTKQDFGLFSNYTSWLTIIGIFVTLNLTATLISARYEYEDDFDGFLFSMLGLSSLSAIIWFVVFNLFGDYFTSLFGMERIYMNVMLLYLFFMPAVDLFQGRERYFFEYKKSVAASLAIAFGTAGLSVLLVVLMEDKLRGRIFGSALPTVVLGLAFYIFFFIKGKKIKLEYWKYALPICLPYIPHLLSLNLLNSMDRVMITKYCGSEQNAIYTLAYTCGSVVTMLMNSMNGAFAPWLGNKLNADDTESIKKVSNTYIIGFVILACGIMAVAPEILFIMGGRAYADAKYVMAPIAMGCVCQFIYTMFVNVEQFKRKTVGMAVASAVAAGVNFVLNWIFIPRVGYLAAAYTTLVGYLCLLLIHMYLVHRLKLSYVYDYKRIALIVTAMMGFTALMAFMYTQPLIRYVFVGIYVIVLLAVMIRYKDMLMSLLKRRK